MKRTVATIALGGALVMGLAPMASAMDRGNHGPIWEADAHDGGLSSGSEWGMYASSTASDGYFVGTGAAPNVHLMKDQPVPGQNR